MKRLLSIFAVFALALPFGAQTLKMEAPNLVAADEQFNVSFTIDGEKAPSDFQWNPGEDFKLVWGPQKGTSTSIRIINGKTNKTSTTTYTYVLMPRREGTFTLPAAVATIKGNKISSGTKSIQVVSGRRQEPSSGTSGDSQRAESTGTISSDDIYMRLLLSGKHALVGENITATLKLYQRVSIAGFEDVRFPRFDGFWSKELQAPSNIEFRRENIGGEIFNTAVLRSWSLTPQKSGELVIDPAELVCLINVRQPSSGGSIFDSFFQDDYRTIRKRISTTPITVHVKPLPSGAPASFGGGVGKFNIKASLTADSLKTHDAASLKVTITGTGNVALLEAPKVNFPPDFELYDVKTSVTGNSKSFEYPFIPRSHGNFSIGPVEYSYYDVSAGRYVTLRSEALALNVQRGESSASEAPSAGGQLLVSQKDVKDLGSDIRFIHTRIPSFTKAGSFFVWSPLYWGLLVALVLIAAALYFAFRKMASMKADVAGARNRGAVKMAKKRLALAGDFLKKSLYSAFYEELHKALLGFVSDKFTMSAAELSRENISLRFEASGAPAELSEDFCKLLDACEYARYAPDSGYEAMNAHYESAISVISRIDSYIKKKPNMKPASLAILFLVSSFVTAGVSHASDVSYVTTGASAPLSSATLTTANATSTAGVPLTTDAEALAAEGADAVSGAPSASANMPLATAPSDAEATASELSTFTNASSAGGATNFADSLWIVGTEAYTDGRFEQARDAWLSLYSAGLSSPELCTNIGNAYYKSDDNAHAILYYERALKLDPSYGDARHNLKFAQSRNRDRIDVVPEFFLVSMIRNLGWKMDSNSWAVLSIILFAGFLAMLLLYRLGRSASSRKTGFFVGIVLLLLFAGALGFASWQKSDFMKADEAIVVSPVVSIKSAPGAENSKDLFILHEGTKVRLLDSVGSWLNIELSDGRQGWIMSENVENI
jgi:tetratricopeptide (TPR) repeat protein